jgi:hypothetical protein
VIKFTGTNAKGKLTIGLILEPANIARLVHGDSVLVDLEQMGVEGVDIFIGYGDKQEFLADARKAGIRIEEEPYGE